MTEKVCPRCKTNDALSIDLSVGYELLWDNREDEFNVGPRLPMGDLKPEDDSTVSCGNCEWEGLFDALTPMTEKLRVVLILDIDPTERGPAKDWDWKDLLDLHSHESVTVDGVNKL